MSQDNKITDYIYIDRLSFFSLSKVIISRLRYRRIFYFNASERSLAIAAFFKKAGALKIMPELLSFHLGDVKDIDGGFTANRIVEDIKDFCLQIKNGEFNNNTFLKGFSGHLDLDKVFIFLEKALAIELHPLFVFINVSVWHLKKQCGQPKAIFLVEKNPWFGYLKRYSQSLGLDMAGYRVIMSPARIVFFNKAIKFFLRRMKPGTKSFSNANNANKESVSSARFEGGPFISVFCTGKAVSFSKKNRSAFFWLINSDIPRHKIIAYFDRLEAADMPICDEKVDIMNKEGIRFISLHKGAKDSQRIPIWKPGTKYRKNRNFLTGLIIKSVLRNILRLGHIRFFYIGYMVYFTEKYSYWLDFFSSNNIKINISPDDFQVPYLTQCAAMEKIGGVNVSYQLSNLTIPSIVTSNCADVLFSFGPAYEEIFRRNRCLADRIVYCGYPVDYTFKYVKEDSASLRKRMSESGAEFIISFFDESSSSDRLFVISDEHAVYVYRYLIEQMMKDKTLGLIFKPKRPHTIYQKLSSIKDLIESAKKTGRCVFIDKGELLTDQLPTEMAQASDLCIGNLFSGTVLLESFLSGTASVFVDFAGMHSHDIYKYGRNRIVFDNFDGLFSAINSYRAGADKTGGFGDLSLWIKDKDVFMDGKASLRMGQYIHRILDAFNEGKEKKDAVAYADNLYKTSWGQDKIVYMAKGNKTCEN